MRAAFQKQLELSPQFIYALVHRFKSLEMAKFYADDVEWLAEQYTLTKMPPENHTIPTLTFTADIPRIEEYERERAAEFKKSWDNATHSFPNN